MRRRNATSATATHGALATDGRCHVETGDQEHQAGDRKDQAYRGSRRAGPELDLLDGLRAADAEHAGVEDGDGDEESERAEDVQEQRDLVVRHVVGSFPSDVST